MPNIITTNVSTPQFAQHSGPFEIGANLYAAAYDQSGGTDRVRMYKSTDNGINWTEQDSATAPTCYKATAFGRRLIDIQQNGSVLYVGYLEVGGTFNIVQFSSDLWGATITGGPTIGGVANPTIGVLSFVRRSANEYLVFWQTVNDVMGSLYEDPGGGPVWSAPFTISTTARLIGSCVDSSARVYIFMMDAGGGIDNTILLRTYTSGNVLSVSDITVATDLVSYGSYVGLPVVYTPIDGLESICIAYARGIRYPGFVAFQTLTPHMAFAQAVIGDTPVFTLEEITYLDNPIGSAAFQEQDYVVCIKSGEPTVFWVSTTGNTFYWEIMYNRKDSCSSRWANLNTVLLNLVIGTTPTNASQIEMIQGRYLPIRDKIALVIYLITTSPSDFAMYYVEV